MLDASQRRIRGRHAFFRRRVFGKLCVPPLDGALGQKLAAIACAAVSEAERYAEGDETDRRFSASWVDSAPSKSLREASERAARQRTALWASLSSSQQESTDLLNEEMGFTKRDWAEIERALGPELRVDENVKGVGTIKTTIDQLTTPEEQAFLDGGGFAG